MRDYDPTTGRYLQADPLGLVDGASVYGYALQNPMRWVDPRGEAIGEGILGGIIGGGIEVGGAIVGGAIAGAIAIIVYPNAAGDGTLPASMVPSEGGTFPDEHVKVDPIPRPVPKKGNWNCTCRAAKNGRSDKNCSDSPDFAIGHGVDKRLSRAIQIAEKAAKQALAAASVHHVPCKCTGPRGERFNRGG